MYIFFCMSVFTIQSFAVNDAIENLFARELASTCFCDVTGACGDDVTSGFSGFVCCMPGDAAGEEDVELLATDSGGGVMGSWRDVCGLFARCFGEPMRLA